MPNRRTGLQSDLFGEGRAGETCTAPPADDFVARIRAELVATLGRVSAAEMIPWSDPTKACLAEMRFHSIANWLPADEARSLCERFEAELNRLYAEAETAAPHFGSEVGQ